MSCFCARRLSTSFLALGISLTTVLPANATGDLDSNVVQSCSLSDDDAAGLNGDAATDVHATTDFQDAALRLLKQSKFDELDCLADGVRSRKERFSGGMWKIHVFYEGVSKPLPGKLHATQDDWEGLLAFLQRWISQKPESVTAHVALARAYMNYAWFARGSGYADSVSDSGWQQFKERTAQAKRLLEQANTLSTKCPEWFNVMMMVAQAEGRDINQIRAVFDEGTKLEPSYYYYSRSLATTLLPQWLGEDGDVEKFAEEISDRVGGDAGNYLYFEISNYVICGCPNEPKMAWPRVIKGFEASEKLYGPSMLNLNWMAKMASRFTDLDAITADKAFKRIGDQWDPNTWETRDEFDSIKAWIAGYAPTVEKRRAMEDAADANLKTPGGPRYKAEFEKKYRKLVQQCDKADGNDIDNMETLTSVGLEGTVEDMKIYSNSVVAMCIYQKLQASKQQKSRTFPAPPHGSYWIRLDLTKADFSSVASK